MAARKRSERLLKMKTFGSGIGGQSIDGQATGRWAFRRLGDGAATGPRPARRARQDPHTYQEADR